MVSGSLLSTLSSSRINEVRFGYSRYTTSFSSLDANFDPVRRSSPDQATFHVVHEVYLSVSTTLWVLGLLFVWWTVRAWHALDAGTGGG